MVKARSRPCLALSIWQPTGDFFEALFWKLDTNADMVASIFNLDDLGLILRDHYKEVNLLEAMVICSRFESISSLNILKYFGGL